MEGDITKRLVARIREYLGDSKRERFKSDMIIHDKLNFYQDYVMITKLTTKVTLEYPLISNQTEYDFGENVVQFVKLWFNDDIQYIPKYSISRATAGDDSRIITLTESDTFREGTDYMYASAYIKSDSDEKISDTIDPIIEDLYHELLITYVVLSLTTTDPYQLIEKHTEEITRRMQSIDMTRALQFEKALSF